MSLNRFEDISLPLAKIALGVASALSDVDLLAIYALNSFYQNKKYYKLCDNLVIVPNSCWATAYCKSNGRIVDFTMTLELLKRLRVKMEDISQVLADLKSQTVIASPDIIGFGDTKLFGYLSEENENIQQMYNKGIFFFKSVCADNYHIACINSSMLANLAEYDEPSQRDLFDFIAWFNQRTDNLIASDVKKLSSRNLNLLQRYNWRAQLARSF